MRFAKQILISSILLSYILFAVFGLFAMDYMNSHHMAIANCPMMTVQHSHCPTSFADHVGALQQRLLAALLPVLILSIPVLYVFFAISLHPPNFFQKRLESTAVWEFFYTHLFSRGILNPKLY